MRPRGSEIAFFWRVPACTGASGTRGSIRRGVGGREETRTICSVAPPNGKKHPLQRADQFEDFSIPEKGSLEKFLLDCKPVKGLMNDPERRGGFQEYHNKLFANLVVGHLSLSIPYQLPPIMSLKTRNKAQYSTNNYYDQVWVELNKDKGIYVMVAGLTSQNDFH